VQVAGTDCEQQGPARTGFKNVDQHTEEVSGAFRHTKVEVDDERMRAMGALKERDVINGQHISKVTHEVPRRIAVVCGPG
jgi:hypothetical protein